MQSQNAYRLLLFAATTAASDAPAAGVVVVSELSFKICCLLLNKFAASQSSSFGAFSAQRNHKYLNHVVEKYIECSSVCSICYNAYDTQNYIQCDKTK